MASNSRAGSIDLRSRNVPATQAGEVDSQEGDSNQHTPASQLGDQGATYNTGATSNNTVVGDGDRGNTAPIDPTPASEDPRFAGLTPV